MANPIKINKSLLQKSINRAGIARQVEAAQVCQAYAQILSEINKKAQSVSRALYVKNRILFVAVPSSAWASEIQMLQHSIVQKINQKLNKRVIERIFFKVTS